MPMPSRFAVALAVLLAPPAALTAQAPVANRLTMEDFLNAEAPKDFFRGGVPTTEAHSPVTAATWMSLDVSPDGRDRKFSRRGSGPRS